MFVVCEYYPVQGFAGAALNVTKIFGEGKDSCVSLSQSVIKSKVSPCRPGANWPMIASSNQSDTEIRLAISLSSENCQAQVQVRFRW